MLKWSITKDKEASNDFLSVNCRRKSYSRPLSAGYFNDNYDFTKQDDRLLNQYSRFHSLSNGNIHSDSINSLQSCEETAVNMNFLDLNGIENLVSSKNSVGSRRRASTLCGGDLKAFSTGNTPKRRLSTPIMPNILIKHGVACPEICVEDSDECYYSENVLAKEELIVCSSDKKLVYYRQKSDSPTISLPSPDLEGPAFSINSDNLQSESNNQTEPSTQKSQQDISILTEIVTPLGNDDLIEASYPIPKLYENDKGDDDTKSNEAAAALQGSISNSENFIKKIKEEHLKEWKCNMILSHKYDEYIKYRIEENKLKSEIDPKYKSHFELDGNKLMYKENLSIYILQL